MIFDRVVLRFSSRGPLVAGAFYAAAVPLFSFALSGSVSALRGQQSSTPAAERIDTAKELRPESVQTQTSVSQDYIISPDDELEITVMDVPELSHDYQVSPAGLISVSVLKDPILAAGLPTRKLAQVMEKELMDAGMVTNPHIAIQVKKSRLHSIAIVGAVARPQIYPVMGTTTLLDALSQAEGVSKDAGNTAVITRGELGLRALNADSRSETDGAAGAPRTITVNLTKLLEEGDPDLNYALYPGDRVTVQRAGVVYVVGAVNKPGGFVLSNEHTQVTVLKALALAESVKSTATAKKSMIIRKDANGTEQDLALDVSKILAGKAPDQVLYANDILFIPDSAAKKALHRAGEAAAQGAALMFYRVP